MRVVLALASLKFTPVGLLLLGVTAVAVYKFDHAATPWLAAPLLLLAINLIAAVATNGVFRKQLPLLVFHLALIALVLLAAAGRLTYLKGSVEISEGAQFDGQLTALEAGPWHRSGLDRVHFSNESFRIAYAPGLQRDNTRNAVRYLDADGAEQRTEIGDQTPLVLAGYRFYTSSNKGFAPTFVWYPVADGAPVLGTVHLPSYPVQEYRQARDWQLPGTAIKVWTMLQFDEVILDPTKQSEFRLPNQYKIIVRIGDLRRELQPAEAIELPEGRLVYDGLRTWMGYSVLYDWTIHWLLAACVVAILSLAWHFQRKFASTPWNKDLKDGS